ncbi:MAG: sigma factor [Syntrophorhabdus sp.]
MTDDSVWKYRKKDKTNPQMTVSSGSIINAVRSRIPSTKSKYDNNKRVDDMYREWSGEISRHVTDRYEKILLLFYELYKPRIRYIAKTYGHLSPVFDEEDLEQTGLIGIFQALINYDHGDEIRMKFSTFLEWSIRNVFQRSIGYDDKFVEIYDSDNNLLKIISYQEFITEKKNIVRKGYNYVIKSRECYLSDIPFSDNLSSENDTNWEKFRTEH